MPETPEPALTPEEWAALSFEFPGGGWPGKVTVFPLDGVLEVRDLQPFPNPFRGKERQGLAALALYGQPFGFTREDVDTLQIVLNGWDLSAADAHKRIASLADRIEALLPPEAPE